MHVPLDRNRDLLMRAVDLMQCLLSPGESPRFSSDAFPEYGLSEFTYDLETCETEDEEFLRSTARTVFETTIQRKMPTLWLLKRWHPVFAIYAALCENIQKPFNFAALLLDETDFPKITSYSEKLIRSPAHIVGIREDTSLSAALEKLPTGKLPWTVLCDWGFDAWDTEVAEAFGETGRAYLLRPR
jgi:hypothetical protein